MDTTNTQDCASATQKRQRLITDHVPLARRIARSMSRRRAWISGGDDIESAALLGLTEAAHRFEPARMVPFSAFASRCVRGAVLDHLRRSDPLTRHARHQARKIDTITRKIETTEGRKPTDTELAAEVGVEREFFRAKYNCLTNPRVLYLEDFAVQPTSALACPSVREEQHQALGLEQAMARLSSRERRVITMYYKEGYTLGEIGLELEVSESRVCQIRGQAVRQLRDELC